MMENKRLFPRESGRWISDRSVCVIVEDEGVERVAEMIYSLRHTDHVTASGWRKTNPLAPDPSSDQALNWVFVVDTMNFSFWPDSDGEQCEITYRGTTYTGYMTLCAAITRAMDQGVPITDPKFFSEISLDQLRWVLRSDNSTNMPMIQERHQVLTEAGRVLLEHGGSFLSFIKPAGNDAQKMVELIVEKIPSYRDEATFENQRVSFYKRAQILVADMWGVMEAGGGGVMNMEWLTMFADYRVPQALVYLGALRYSDALMETLKKGEMLPSGDRREVEIRGCSIWSVELIRERLHQMVQDRDSQTCSITSALIDFYLWPYAKQHHTQMAHIPIHHTRCIYY
ncbi:queuosine 5'-phosphate N-glycosylase/hydrolase [Gouania willdenowi]|uniref:Queuosine 5'-phosphate N-glycosylase/hydrolase n=1 Tax=Gouania willdenowi TaxID=441366 RepID=A0A8C5DQ57_GOUWI|nr:queuosine salvage protein [Gouania willdenowi]XP_028294541.1 queuosine salvage protein [Gouania willdenowi]